MRAATAKVASAGVKELDYASLPFAPSRSPEGKEEVLCADALGIERPYLLVDVEVGMRFRAAVCGESVRDCAHCLADTAGGGESCAVTREELSDAAGEVWSSIFRFDGEEPKFPALLDGSNARPALGKAQLEDKELAPLVDAAAREYEDQVG